MLDGRRRRLRLMDREAARERRRRQRRRLRRMPGTADLRDAFERAESVPAVAVSLSTGAAPRLCRRGGGRMLPALRPFPIAGPARARKGGGRTAAYGARIAEVKRL